jgi:hypothetical protein
MWRCDEKSKTILVTDYGGLWGCEMLRIPHCLDSQITDGGEVVSLTDRPRFTPKKYYFSASGTYFCQKLSKPQGPMRLEGLGKFKNKLYYLIGNGDGIGQSVYRRAAGWTVEVRCPARPKDFIFSKAFVSVLAPTQPPIQRVPEAPPGGGGKATGARS